MVDRRVVGYCYPWDVIGDPVAPDRYSAVGVETVALAASYHTTRAATPSHPAHRTVDAHHAACYVPVRRSSWTGRLVPSGPSWMASADAFGDAAARLRAAGLDVHAWIVLTHNSLLGKANPDLVVTNAFGERYPWALCPADDEVVEYCDTLVAEVLATQDVDGVVLEACGALGAEHGGHHDKVELSGWDRATLDLLSLCFCAACVTRLRAASVDAGQLAARVRTAVDAPSFDSVEEALGSELARQVTQVRLETTAALQDTIIQRVGASLPGGSLALHATTDPWATGAFATVAGSTDRSPTMIVSGWHPPSTVDRLAAMRSWGATHTGVYLRPDSGWPDDDRLDAEIAALHTAGMSEAHLYHLGLCGPAGLGVLRRLAAAFPRA